MAGFTNAVGGVCRCGDRSVSKTRAQQIDTCFHRIDGAIKLLLTDPADILPSDVRKEAQRAAVRHHIAHFEKLPIRETSVCPYKIASWYGFALSQRAEEMGKDPNKNILRGAITAMASFLREEGKHLPGTTATVLLVMASNHRRPGLDDFAIGPNGLYTSFFAAKTARLFAPCAPHEHP